MRARSLLASAAALALSACVGGRPPEVAAPAPVLPASFLYSPSGAEQASLDALLPTNDAAFTRLADRVLAGSPTLAEALARIDQARAQADRAGAERLPSIGADGNVAGNRINPAQFGGALPPGIAIDRLQTSYGANVTARWDPDLFGVLRAQERAANLRITAAEAGAAAVRLALVGELAANVIDYRTLDRRAAELRRDLDAANDLARLSGVRERSGIAPGFDRVRAEAQAATSRSQLEALESQRVQLIGRLVTLTATGGQEVRAALASDGPAVDLPAPPPATPSLLLLNRPDVQQAAAELLAADADLAATARQRFPRLTLSSGLGLLAFGLGDLFDTGSIVGSLAAGLAAPLLDFGRIEADVAGAAAAERAAFAAYRGTVFIALGDAEAAYGLIAAADREAAAAVAERDAAQRAARLADTRFRAGLADFLTVLDARRAANASGDRAAAAIGRAQRARVLLWQALGGEPVEVAAGTAPQP